MSSFDLSHSREPHNPYTGPGGKRNKTFVIKEVEASRQSPINIWRYKDSPYKQNDKKEPDKDAMHNNAFRKFRESQKHVEKQLNRSARVEEQEKPLQNGEAKAENNHFYEPSGPRASIVPMDKPKNDVAQEPEKLTENIEISIKPATANIERVNTPMKVKKTNFETQKTPRLNNEDLHDTKNVVILDLQDMENPPRSSRYYNR